MTVVHERLIAYFVRHPAARFVTLAEIADEPAGRHPVRASESAMMV